MGLFTIFYPCLDEVSASEGVTRVKLSIMGLLPDTQYCGLRMRQESWERLPGHLFKKETAS